jgi:cysteine dioxygenase|tara:strand:+ start:3760 stop:5136 length:1377 start_codon:yes stop_codon:yes gene_type:complete
LKEIKNQIKEFNQKISFESLGKFVESIDFNNLNYQEYIVNPDHEGDYGRNIIVLNPFECVLINWPAGVESSVHHHQGLFGYVLVLEGALDNISYREENNKLIEFKSEKYISNGIMPEEDGVIHKLANRNLEKRAITLHFYYPAIESFEGMRIFNLENESIGILSKHAKTAKWNNNANQFKEIKQKAFKYQSIDELNKDKSHLIQNIFPKPDSDRINDMNSRYFSEQAQKYDFSDFNQPSRKAYINKVDQLIASDMSGIKISKHLDIAVGTGRRAIHIKKLSGLRYEIIGVEISEEMCKIANSRGLRTYHQDWANDDAHIGEMFDSATFLYAFGHIANRNKRLKSLKKIHSYLNEGCPIYLDLFSLTNKNEWGPFAVKAFEKNKLDKHGYERGDVFYKKRGFKELAFLHYFEMNEIEQLFKETGFEIKWIKYLGYSKNSGKLVNSEKEGNFLIKAIKIT